MLRISKILFHVIAAFLVYFGLIICGGAITGLFPALKYSFMLGHGFWVDPIGEIILICVAVLTGKIIGKLSLKDYWKTGIGLVILIVLVEYKLSPFVHAGDVSNPPLWYSVVASIVQALLLFLTANYTAQRKEVKIYENI